MKKSKAYVKSKTKFIKIPVHHGKNLRFFAKYNELNKYYLGAGDTKQKAFNDMFNQYYSKPPGNKESINTLIQYFLNPDYYSDP